MKNEFKMDMIDEQRAYVVCGPNLEFKFAYIEYHFNLGWIVKEFCWLTSVNERHLSKTLDIVNMPRNKYVTVGNLKKFTAFLESMNKLRQ